MKVGRNDPCPCGSGRKYKQCCLKKESLSEYDLIRTQVKNSGADEKIADLLCNLYRYMNEKQWMGACHATSSVLYVALSELGFKPKLYIGEVDAGLFWFDHSWIVLDEKIIDLAAAITLQGGAPVSGPIIFDNDIRTGCEYKVTYGVKKSGLDAHAMFLMQMPFSEYMDNFPDEQGGLWGVLKLVYPGKISIEDIKEKYSDVKREYLAK